MVFVNLHRTTLTLYVILPKIRFNVELGARSNETVWYANPCFACPDLSIGYQTIIFLRFARSCWAIAQKS